MSAPPSLDEISHAATAVSHPARGLRHWIGFVGSGTLAFIVDAGVVKFLTLALGVPLLPARLVSIALAMVAGWLAHRTFTFSLTTPPRLMEFVRYLGVACPSAVLNYALFVAIVTLRPETGVVVAIVVSGGVAMVASYLGLRFAAFRGAS